MGFRFRSAMFTAGGMAGKREGNGTGRQVGVWASSRSVQVRRSYESRGNRSSMPASRAVRSPLEVHVPHRIAFHVRHQRAELAFEPAELHEHGAVSEDAAGGAFGRRE